ncbi:MAG TPA: 6-carboxytetrahydropterin synthase [Ktedonobacteraceae bacterium]|jgi:6-pyruvoyltetrahydropterin/6-carboxytetrahydropterin synthase
MTSIYIEHTFDAGHRIVGHKGKCARLHGHTYKVDVTLRGQVRDPGFVADFGEVKDVINRWDHRTLLWEQDPLYEIADPDLLFLQGIIWVPFNPTAEHMARELVTQLATAFDLYGIHLTLWETPKCSAQVGWAGG